MNGHSYETGRFSERATMGKSAVPSSYLSFWLAWRTYITHWEKEVHVLIPHSSVNDPRPHLVRVNDLFPEESTSISRSRVEVPFAFGEVITLKKRVQKGLFYIME